jgi:hypothetical protein
MDHSPPGCATRPLSGCLVIILATLVLLGTVTGVFELACYNEMNKFVIPYPDSVITHVDYNFLQPKGVGRTIYYMESDADPLTIQGWYGRLAGETARGRRLTRVRYYATHNEDRTGSDIVIAASCIQTLPN